MRLPVETESDTIVRSAKARALRRVSGPAVPAPRAKRNHPKRHSVNGERSKERAAKSVLSKRRAADNLARSRQIRNIMRAYFAGEIADLSALHK